MWSSDSGFTLSGQKAVLCECGRDYDLNITSLCAIECGRLRRMQTLLRYRLRVTVTVSGQLVACKAEKRRAFPDRGVHIRLICSRHEPGQALYENQWLSTLAIFGDYIQASALVTILLNCSAIWEAHNS